MMKVRCTDAAVAMQAQLSRVALLELHIELQAVLTPNLRWLAELDVTCANLTLCVGWHPLAAAVVDSFHPNDLTMLDSVNRILVVTGANGSGKSIFLQQVGIIVHLAHIGCFVPAESAEIGLVYTLHSQGTLPVDGASLLISCLSHFSLQAKPPKLVCVTHCLETAKQDLLPRC